MKKIILLLSLFCFCSLGFTDTIPIQNVYLKSVTYPGLQVTSYYWGVSGNLTTFENTQKPERTALIISLFETSDQILNNSQLQSLENFVKFTKRSNWVSLEFEASQIALSEYNKKYCGLFYDIEDTFDLDMPLNPLGKDESSQVRLEINFVFDISYQDIMLQKYEFLEEICKRRIKVH